MNPDSSTEKPVRLRQRLREATAGAILDAAEQVFAAEGFRARMESIAARAGIAVGTLYNHFADREALWEALRRSRREALLARLDGALEGARGAPFPDALRAFAGALEAHWAAHRGFLTLLVHAEPAVAQAGARAQRERTLMDELEARAERLVRLGVADGSLRQDGHALFPALLVGTLRALIVHEVARGRAVGPGALEAAVAFFLDGAGRRA